MEAGHQSQPSVNLRLAAIVEEFELSDEAEPAPVFEPDINPWATAAEIAADVGAGRTSATSVIEGALARIKERNPTLNAFTAVTAERALRKRGQ